MVANNFVDNTFKTQNYTFRKSAVHKTIPLGRVQYTKLYLKEECRTQNYTLRKSAVYKTILLGRVPYTKLYL